MEQDSMVAPSTFVFKVNISCRECERDIKKAVQKIPGVWPDSVVIDAEQGRVTVSGFVDPQTVISELRKAGKTAKLLVPHSPPAPPAANRQIVARSIQHDRNQREQIVSQSILHDRNQRSQVVDVAQVVNGIKRLKEVEVTRDRIKMSFYDYRSGTSSGSGGGGGTSHGSGSGGGGGGTSRGSNGTSRGSGGGGGGGTSGRSGGGSGTSHGSGGGGTSGRSGGGGGGGGTSHRSGGGGDTSHRSGGGGGGGHHISL